jgi:hypothetical protein
VDLLHPFFPPLLDTSEVDENLAPKKIHLEYLDQATVDQIMDKHMKVTHQQNIQLCRVIKAWKLLHKASGSLVEKLNNIFPI